MQINDSSTPFPADQIEAIKEGKRRRLIEARFIMDASLSDINLDLVALAGSRAGLNMSPEAVLTHYRIAERRDGKFVLTLAALLLFGNDPDRWHPRCGIDFTQYKGSQRKAGSSLNIIKRIRIEAPLVKVIEDAYEAIQARMNESQPLVGLFFTDGLEYPSFAWQEAIVNAVAHRDYRYEGASIEVEMFDNRLEIRSPGELVEPVTLERLRQRERVHASRNPRMVLVLSDFGYMREKGEAFSAFLRKWSEKDFIHRIFAWKPTPFSMLL